MKEKLKVGLLIDSYNIPSWAYKMIEQISLSNHSKIALIVRNSPTVKQKGSKLQRIWKRRSEISYSLYSKSEAKLYKPYPNAFESCDLSKIISCDEIEVKPKETRFSDRILEEDITKISKYEIDVFIRLGFRILRGAILNISKYGVWSYHHGDNHVNRGGPAGVWEVLQQWDETGVTLQILTEDLDGGTVLFESTSATDEMRFNRNKNNYYWKAMSFIPRKLSELHRDGEEQFFKNVAHLNAEPSFYYNRIFKTPNNSELLRGVLKNYWGAVRRKIYETFFFEQWILLYKMEKEPTISKSFFRFKRITPPKDRFWADPFVVKKVNEYYIFIEELVYKEGKGKISVIVMDEKGNYDPPQVVLERDYHLSYPFIFEREGTFYMIPESVENKSIELFRCTDFPYEWRFEKTLISDVEAVDATIFEHNGLFWLFTNIRENPGASTYDELFLYYSDDPTSDKWTAHPQNPIVSDVKCSRPAGNIFKYKNRMYRPAQNCAKIYGYGMQIREILEISKTRYRERQVQSIYPNWDKDLVATHTLNHSGNLTVIDAFIKRRKL